MAVKARFYVREITRFAHAPSQVNVTLQAVTRGEENKEWAAATPYGEIKMNISNGTAGQWFEERLGKDVVLTFDSDDDEVHLSQYSV